MKSYPMLKRWLAAVATFAIISAVVVAGLATSAANQNKEATAKKNSKYPWPLFGGSVQRNLINLTDRGVSLSFDLDPKQLNKFDPKNAKNVKWWQDLGSRSYGGPVIAEGKVFVGTNNEAPRDPKIKGDKGVIMCFEEATGTFLWQKTYDKLKAGRVNDWPLEGICSTPVIENGKMYYVCNRCWLVCADTSTGKIVWHLDMIDKLGVFPHNLATCSPLIVGNTIFLCTSNGVDKDHINIPAPKAPSFVAVNKTNGKVLWQNNAPSANLLKLPAGQNRERFIKKLVNSGQLLMHGQWANPSYTEVKGVAQIIFPGGDGWLRAFDPSTGKLIWKFDCNPKTSVYELGGKGTRSDFVNTPVVANNKLYIGVGQDPEHDEGVGHFWCIDLVKATKLGGTNKDHDVSPQKDNFDPKATVNKNSALAWHYGGLGTPKTRPAGARYLFGRTLSTACVQDGLVYITELAGYLHCLDAETGERYWYHNFRAPIWSSPYYVDGRILVGTDDEYLYIFKHGKKGNQPEERLMFGKVRATPVVANGTLYVLTGNRIYALGK